MAGIVLRGVHKSFGEVEVIRGIDLEIEDREFVVFVGPSGCGKSTMLRLIGGLEEATEGQIIIGDQDVTGLPPAERSLSMVFQSYALYPHKTVRENMACSTVHATRLLSWHSTRVGRSRLDGRLFTNGRYPTGNHALEHTSTGFSGAIRVYDCLE